MKYYLRKFISYPIGALPQYVVITDPTHEDGYDYTLQQSDATSFDTDEAAKVAAHAFRLESFTFAEAASTSTIESQKSALYLRLATLTRQIELVMNNGGTAEDLRAERLQVRYSLARLGEIP